MGIFSEELKKYYKKGPRKILFKEKFTLSETAMKMWEALDYTQIDQSVLSRTIKGERLFTPEQLEVFCHVLRISGEEKKILFQSLYQEYHAKKGFDLSPGLKDKNIFVELIDDLIKEEIKLHYQGKGQDYYRLSLITATYLAEYTRNNLSQAERDKLEELEAINLYLQGKYLTSTLVPSLIFQQTQTLVERMLTLSEKLQSKSLYIYAHSLLSEINYVAGGYSTKEYKRRFFHKSISHAQKVIAVATNTDRQAVQVLRHMAASAIYSKDEDTYLATKNKTIAILDQQPLENKFEVIQLTSIFSKGDAMFKKKDPHPLKEKAEALYKNDHGLVVHGTWEISELKNDIDTLLLLETTDSNFLKFLIHKGLALTSQGECVRHNRYFKSLLKNL